MEQIVTYSITDAAIAKMEAEYMGLTVKGLDDEAGFSQVHAARMVVKNHRVAIEKKRKELKADALEYGRKVDSEAKRITAMLDPIETHLQTEEDKVTKEKERIKAEKIRIEEERVAKIRNRIEMMKSVAIINPLLSAEDIRSKLTAFIIDYVESDFDYGEFIDQAHDTLREVELNLNETLKNRTRWEADQAAAKAEAERLEKIRKEQEAAQAKIDTENARIAEESRKLQAEKDRIEREKKADQEKKDREEFERKAKEEARIQAEKDAQERAEKAEVARKEKEIREAREAQERMQREAEEAARIESLRPDKEKFAKYIDELRGIPIPTFSSPAMTSLISVMFKDLKILFNHYKKKVEVL